MNYTPEEFLHFANKFCQNTMIELLEIEFIEVGKDFLKAKMPITPKVHQPLGLLHGGASVALAESVGSSASLLFVDIKKYEVRGIEISANHLKSKKDGTVFATARIIHKGKTIHLWEIKITDEEDQLISLCKLTNIVLERKNV